MELAAELEQVADDLAAAEREVFRWTARVEGLRAQRAALERAVATGARLRDRGSADLREMSRMAGIEELLRRSPGPLSIPFVVRGLAEAGRAGDSYAVVAATLQQLMNSGRVTRPSRGLYEAA